MVLVFFTTFLFGLIRASSQVKEAQFKNGGVVQDLYRAIQRPEENVVLKIKAHTKEQDECGIAAIDTQTTTKKTKKKKSSNSNFKRHPKSCYSTGEVDWDGK